MSGRVLPGAIVMLIGIGLVAWGLLSLGVIERTPAEGA